MFFFSVSLSPWQIHLARLDSLQQVPVARRLLLSSVALPRGVQLPRGALLQQQVAPVAVEVVAGKAPR